MTITGILMALIIGAIVGALGRLVVPGKQNIPIWLTIVVGIVAAFLGTLLARAIGIPTETGGFDSAATVGFETTFANPGACRGQRPFPAFGSS